MEGDVTIGPISSYHENGDFIDRYPAHWDPEDPDTWTWGGDDDDSDSSSKPVLLDLDLDGNGFDIDTLNTSTKYIDFDNDGFETRTAWAGAGTGVLILDADGDGKISDSKEFAFTEWDPAADSDLAALKGIFDTNNNGKLDSGDARWSQFKVAVGDQLVSLASLGIASIDLTPSGSGQVFEDGSAITGTTTYTKTDGSTGLVGDATLAGETSQYILKRSTSTSGGAVTVTTSGYEAEGQRVFRNSVATSADGIWDRSQTDVKSVSETGAVTRAISNFNADGSLHDRTSTTTSADQKTITTYVDQNGDGETDQKQTVVISANGSSTTTVWQYAIDNDVLKKVLTSSSADGLTKIVKTDLDGAGSYDIYETTTTVIATDGSRAITKETRPDDGSLLFKEGQVISADGRTKTLQYDRNGNGTYEEKVTSAITVSGGNIVTTTSRLSANNTLLDSSVTTRSTNGRSTSVERDINGDGTVDLTSSDVLSVSSAGTRTRTLTEKSGDGILLSKQTIVTSANGGSVTTTTDINGDGERDTVHKITTDENGVTTTVDAVFNADGSYRSRVEQVTNAAGTSTTTTFDLDGNGAVDLTTTDLLQSVNGCDRRRTVSTTSADGSLLDRVLTETTADGLNRTTSHDVDGNGTYDRVIATENVLNTDGSRVQRVTTKSANGSLISKSTATTSADRRTTATDVDTDGDGITDYKEYAQLYTDGRTRLAQAKRNADGSLRWRDETIVSADKLLTTVTHDLDGDDVIDYTDKKQTTLNADGSQTTVSSLLSNSGEVLSSESATLSGNGLTKTTASDLNGNGVAERTMVEAIDFTSAGNTTKTVTIRGGDDALIFKSTETTSGSGLQVTLAEDLDGSGSTDRTTISTIALAQDGSSTKTTQVKNRSGGLTAKETIVTTGDTRVVTTAVDLDGNGADDKRSATTIGYDGSLVETASTFNSSGDKTSSMFAVTSNSGLKKLILADVDGDGIDDTRRSITTVLNADGGKTTTTRLATAAGSRLEQEIYTLSADGLSISSVWSGAGGSATRSMSDVTVLNASGSTTRTVQYFKADGSLDRKTVTTLRADGTVASILEDLNGDGTNDVSTTMTKSANGDETYLSKQISSYLDGDLSDNRKRTTVGNASKETVFFSVDGSGAETVARRISEARSFSTSGSEIYTTTYYRGTQLAGGSKVTTSGDKLSITREWDLNANSTYETKQTDVTSLGNNGAITHTVSDYASGAWQAKRTTITSANGLTVNATWETFGSSATTQTSSDVTTINDSGSRTQEITYNNGSSLLSQYEITTSSDGRTKTIKQDLDGSGSYEKTIVTTTLVLADGSSYQDRKIKTAAGTLLETETTILSADERYLTVKRDRDGDGDTDQSEKTTIFLDGRKETTLTNFKQDGVSKGSELSIDVTADGLRTVAVWDRDGDGDIEQKKTSTKKVFSDGSIETVDVYENLDQPSQPEPQLKPWFFFNPNRWRAASSDNYNSGAGWFRGKDGFSIHGAFDVTGAGNSSYLGQHNATIKTVISGDGLSQRVENNMDGIGTADRVETIEIDASGAVKRKTHNDAEVARETDRRPVGQVYWKEAVAYNVLTTESADGLTTTVKADYDGNGGDVTGSADMSKFEYLAVSKKQIDGSIITEITEKSESGAVIAKGTMTVSADGLVTTLLKDSNNDGTVDHRATSTVLNDGSIIHSIVENNANGKVLKTVVKGYDPVGNEVYSISADDSSDQISLTGSLKFEDLSFAWSGSSLRMSLAPYANLGRATLALDINPELTKIKIGSSTYNLFIAPVPGATVIGSGDSDVLFGVNGTEILKGTNGDDILFGGSGSDNLQGNNGNDTFYGGTGNDVIQGGSGDDTIVFRRGDGTDTFEDIAPGVTTASSDINEAQALGVHANGTVNTWVGGYYWQTSSNSLLKAYNGGNEIISFGKNIAAEDLSFSWEGETLIVTVGASASGDKLKLRQQTIYAGRIDRMAFEGQSARYFLAARSVDGNVDAGDGDDLIFGLEGNNVLKGYEGHDEMYGGLGNDTLYGGSGNDVLIGGKGADTLRGEWDNDRYVYRKGDGNDTYEDLAGIDVLDLQGGIRPEDLVASWNGQNVKLTVGGAASGDSITILNQTGSRIDMVRFENYGEYYLTPVGMSAPAVFGNKPGNAVIGTNSSEQLIGTNLSDLLVGAAGNDTLEGGDGSDRYLFGTGAGAHIVRDSGGDQDEIVFGEGIDNEDLWFQRNGDDLVISVLDKNDKVTVEGWFGSSNPMPIERIVAGNGEVLKSANINALVSAMASFQPATGSNSTGVHASDLDVNNPAPVGTVAVAIGQNWMAA